eukprot:11671300-Karenia_brevis.AAC.1
MRATEEPAEQANATGSSGDHVDAAVELRVRNTFYHFHLAPPCPRRLASSPPILRTGHSPRECWHRRPGEQIGWEDHGDGTLGSSSARASELTWKFPRPGLPSVRADDDPLGVERENAS